MRRISLGLLACTAAAAGLLAWLSGFAHAADSPLAGNWKLVVMAAGQEISVWIVQVEDKDGKPQVSVVAELPNFKGTKVENVRADDKGVHFTLQASGLDFLVDAYLPAGEKKPEKLLGSVGVRGQREFIRLERSADKKIDPDKATTETPALADLRTALGAADAKERTAALKELMKKYPNSPAAYVAAQQLLSAAAKAESEADAKTATEQAIKIAATYGPETQVNAALQAARAVARSDKLTGLYVDFARQAAKALGDNDPAAVQAPVLKTLAAALKKAGKTDELKPLQARITKLDEQLDREFEKNAIPFKPEAFAGRQGKSDRVAVVELFTGAQCPPCVAADVAFDALAKTYKPADVVLLQYHLHIPGPDPMTNKDSEKRSEFYTIEGTPTLFVNGKEGPAMGGGKAQAEDRYKTARKQIDAALETNAGAKLKLTADRKGDKIDLQAEYGDLARPGENVRLRFVVVEELVRYPGGNGQRLHHHVVRALPGGVEGVALKEKAGKHAQTVSVAELEKELSGYLDDFTKKNNFAFDDQPLELKHLKAVALIQDNGTKEILQAVQVDLPAAK
jgi:hypothetical protein